MKMRQRLFGMLLSVALVAIAAGGALAQEATPSPSPTGSPVTWVAQPADSAFGEGRTYFAYEAEPGESLRDAMAITNRSRGPITLRVYASDAFTTPSGGIDLLPADQTPVDVGTWVSLETDTVTLDPQQSVVVPFTLTVPDNATPGDHSGGIVTSLVTAGEGVQVDYRLGSRLYVRVAGDLLPSLAVSDVGATYAGRINPIEPGSAEITYTVTNTGNVRLQAHQLARVSGPLGLFGREATYDDLPEILPGNSITASLAVDGVWPATLMTAAIQLQPFAGPDDPPLPAVAPVTGSAEVWAWPWGQALVVLAVVAVIVWRRRSQRMRQQQVDAVVERAVAAALQAAGHAKGEGATDAAPPDAAPPAGSTDTSPTSTDTSSASPSTAKDGPTGSPAPP